MIRYIEKGDIFRIDGVSSYAHGCNCAGAMGKGIAVQFKSKYPDILYGSNGKIEKMYSKGSRGSREETYFYENDRLQKIVIRQFDRNDIEQDTLQHSFDYKSNGELKSIILSTELYSETIYQET